MAGPLGPCNVAWARVRGRVAGLRATSGLISPKLTFRHAQDPFRLTPPAPYMYLSALPRLQLHFGACIWPLKTWDVGLPSAAAVHHRLEALPVLRPAPRPRARPSLAPSAVEVLLAPPTLRLALAVLDLSRAGRTAPPPHRDWRLSTGTVLVSPANRLWHRNRSKRVAVCGVVVCVPSPPLFPLLPVAASWHTTGPSIALWTRQFASRGDLADAAAGTCASLSSGLDAADAVSEKPSDAGRC